MVPFASWYWTMAVAKSSPDVLVLGTSAGLYRSTDGGTSWQAVGPTGVNATSLVQDGSTMFMAGAHIASANATPIIRSGSGRTVADGAPVVASSTDDGATWTVLHPRGLANVAVQALAVDPSGGSSLYALLNNGALYRSTDRGASFQLVSPRLGVSPWALAITANSRFVAGDMDSGSHVSANARAWQPSPFADSAGGRMVMEYAVQPTHSTRVLMTSIGVVASSDGGKTWHVTLHSPVMFGPVAFAAGSPSDAYAVGFDRSLWRTTDAGAHWTKVT
jgi:photosystem II stability/assembly factor-like uncharacterized protein